MIFNRIGQRKQWITGNHTQRYRSECCWLVATSQKSAHWFGWRMVRYLLTITQHMMAHHLHMFRHELHFANVVTSLFYHLFQSKQPVSSSWCMCFFSLSLIPALRTNNECVRLLICAESANHQQSDNRKILFSSKLKMIVIRPMKYG